MSEEGYVRLRKSCAWRSWFTSLWPSLLLVCGWMWDQVTLATTNIELGIGTASLLHSCPARGSSLQLESFKPLHVLLAFAGWNLWSLMMTKRKAKETHKTNTLKRPWLGSKATLQAGLRRNHLTSATTTVVRAYAFCFTLITITRLADFQRTVYEVLRSQTEVGTKISYKELSFKAVGNERTGRAVGTAMRLNPYPVIVPCHRVIKSSGDLGAYTGGKGIKETLISHEANHRSPKSIWSCIWCSTDPISSPKSGRTAVKSSLSTQMLLLCVRFLNLTSILKTRFGRDTIS